MCFIASPPFRKTAGEWNKWGYEKVASYKLIILFLSSKQRLSQFWFLLSSEVTEISRPRIMWRAEIM